VRAPELSGPRLVLRAIGEADLDDLLRIASSPAVARWWSAHDRTTVRRWLADDGETIRWAILLDGAVAGKIQAYEEGDPEFRHAGLDLFLDESAHGQGLGAEAIRVVATWLFDERGHHRLVIDPALANERAIRCYERVGFRRVGVMRSYWYDRTAGAWADGLLLDLLRGELA
jgi:aminoglycoside 6'-N-acetyltransferase